MNDQDVTVKLSLMNNIMGYLGTRPYGEVFQIVQAIQEQVAPQLQVAPEVKAQQAE